jgi:outer membrane immunogenic protein
MQRRVFAAIGLLFALMMVPAQAGDLPSRPLPQPRAPRFVPFFTWNGLYVGFNAGYAFGQSNWTDTVTRQSTGNFDLGGALLGATVGYNYQAGGTVFGLEGDIGWSNLTGSTTTNCTTRCETNVAWLGTGRLRIGYAFDRFLPYFTGGAAFGDIKANNIGVGSFAKTQFGWAIGGGIEYAFIDHWSAKVEYLYVDLAAPTCDLPCSGGNPRDVSFNTNILRGGVNYKF